MAPTDGPLCRGESRELPPLSESDLQQRAVRGGGEEVSAGAEVVADRAIRCTELLGVLGRLEALEPLEHPLSSTGRAVAVLRPIDQPLVSLILYAGEHLAACRRVAGQRIRDHDPRCVSAPVDHPPQKGLHRFLVATRLDRNAQYGPFLIYRAPQPVLAASDLELHFIEVSLIARPRAPPSHAGGERLPELPTPAADRLIADGDAALRQ